MDLKTLHRRFFSENTVGYRTIQKFFVQYRSLLAKNGSTEFHDLLNEVFVSISQTNFSKIIKIEHYVHRAIKIQCWAILDKCKRYERKTNTITLNDEDTIEEAVKSNDPGPIAQMETQELLKLVIHFKQTLNSENQSIFNELIENSDESFVDLATKFNLNGNTFRTKVKRLRSGFAEYLRSRGYHHPEMEIISK